MVLSARVVVNVVDFQSLEADSSHSMLFFSVSLKLIFAIFTAFDVAVDVLMANYMGLIYLSSRTPPPDDVAIICQPAPALDVATWRQNLNCFCPTQT